MHVVGAMAQLEVAAAPAAFDGIYELHSLIDPGSGPLEAGTVT